jgi:hypothetical protein
LKQWLDNSQRHKLVHGLDELKGEHIVDLGADETLEDTKKSLDLVVLDDEGSTAHEEGLPKTDEGRDVATLLPELGREERGKKSLVLGRKVRGLVELEELGEDLEDVGDEL